MTPRRMLSSLFRVVLEEADRNPDFEARLRDALDAAGTAQAKEFERSNRGKKLAEQQEHKAAPVGVSAEAKRPSNRRPPALLDPVQVVREGEQSLRTALGKLRLDQLHDIVADYGMDPGKVVMKWRTEKRVIDRIVEVSLTRASKGDAFRGQRSEGGDEYDRQFTAQVCQQRLVVECANSGAGFWLSPDRATHGFSGVTISIHNHLPFDIEINFRRLEARIDSNGLLDSTLNSSAKVGAGSSSSLVLPELALSDRQVKWLTNLKRDALVVDITLHWSVDSSVRNWEQSQQIRCPATVSKTSRNLNSKD